MGGDESRCALHALASHTSAPLTHHAGPWEDLISRCHLRDCGMGEDLEMNCKVTMEDRAPFSPG
jgi:hypothetical protein